MSSAWYFNPRSPHGERQSLSAPQRADVIFQSTLPARGATGKTKSSSGDIIISIHAPRTGSDTTRPENGGLKDISIHAPRTGSDKHFHTKDEKCQYFNPRSPHGERPVMTAEENAEAVISIHAPRTGSDVIKPETYLYNLVFQSTLPARGATMNGFRKTDEGIFQSTLPARGATSQPLWLSQLRQFQSTLPARGATCVCDGRGACDGFQSTLPARGATLAKAQIATAEEISIHAPRTGSDPTRVMRYCCSWLISIHAPRTGSDASEGERFTAIDISIHAPRTGSDKTPRRCGRSTTKNFNPRSPHGERHPLYNWYFAKRIFQSTLPARGATGSCSC